MCDCEHAVIHEPCPLWDNGGQSPSKGLFR